MVHRPYQNKESAAPIQTICAKQFGTDVLLHSLLRLDIYTGTLQYLEPCF